MKEKFDFSVTVGIFWLFIITAIIGYILNKLAFG